MYGGKQELVTIRFINRLLDSVVDRFGTSGVQYSQMDEGHFKVTANVEISDQFFGWLLGFGKRVKLLEPQSAVDRFSAYLDKIREMY
jgi:predicted DNA-binding transcriptional regulator YafY